MGEEVPAGGSDSLPGGSRTAFSSRVHFGDGTCIGSSSLGGVARPPLGDLLGDPPHTVTALSSVFLLEVNGQGSTFAGVYVFKGGFFNGMGPQHKFEAGEDVGVSTMAS